VLRPGRRAGPQPNTSRRAVKGFADGSIGSRTAALFEPYSDERDNRGILSAEMQPPEAMRERLMKADGAGFGDRIVAVGSSAEVDRWRGPETRVIDAHRKLLLPGFNDAHVHFTDGGAALAEVQLNDATSAEEFKRRIAARAAKTAKGEWVLGGDWDETKWTSKQPPTDCFHATLPCDR
jgi:predicted amidohydrolase YtcJ